jgi:pSer/pThr/pTyr-binding forkhead associated (FHA) protein
MWKLVIEDDEGKRTVVPLTRDQYSIGRKDGNTIRLTERNVSRDHARLHKRNGVRPGAAGAAGGSGAAGAQGTPGTPGVEQGAGAREQFAFVLEDLTSYNGVFVNGLRVAQTQDLAHGDLVQIGDYRIVLQDEALADSSGLGSDPKQTVPNAPSARAAGLLDRPNRLVMLAGPSPGAEFPLDRERLTIGRAEDAGISVNHNSVSRLHCEVHALGDGRFEIVDKGSSNGVRVNGADLRRGIIEPGDKIELGDVRFKFVGAGQIFRATDSAQHAAVPERAVKPAARRTRHTNSLPVAAFVVVVVAGAIGAWVYTRPRTDRSSPAMAVAPSAERAALEEAKILCASGDYDRAHDKLVRIGDASLRVSEDFREIENKWADDVLARANAEPDLAAKRLLFQRVAEGMSVEPARRKIAADRLQALDIMANTVATNPMQLPVASATGKADETPTTTSWRPDAGRRYVALDSQPAAPPVQVTVPRLPPPPSLPVVTPPKPSGPSVDDRERQLALQGTSDAKMLLKQQLEQRVSSGTASDTEIRLLISTCKDLGDKVCVQQARAVQAQRP